MRRLRRTETFAAWGAVTALLLAPMTATPALAADTIVIDAGFETLPLPAGLQQSGNPTLSIVEVDGDPALSVGGRANDYDGIQTAPAALAAGTTYRFSVDARLAAGTVGTANLRLVVNFNGGGGTYAYAAAADVTADGWTTLTGEYAIPAGATEPKVYTGSGPLGGSADAYGFVLDDFVVTALDTAPGGPITPSPDVAPGGFVNPTTTELAAAQGSGNVAALTFDDGPAPDTDALLDFLAEQGIPAVFCVIGSQIQQPGGAETLRRIVDEGHVLCNHSTGFASMDSLTPEQVQADLEQNLRIIREALGDPDAPVPFFRAPNGAWGQTREVAVALGMQPLAVSNLIFDWDGNDLSVETLEANIRTAMEPGRILLAHDGPANRANTVAAIRTVVAERLAEGWSFTLPAGTPAATDPGTPGAVVLETSFEEGLDGWQLRRSSNLEVAPTVDLTTEQARTGAQSAVVANRGNQGDGIGLPVVGTLLPGITYELSAWVRFAAGQPAGDIWVTLQADSAFLTQAQVTGLSNGEWREVTASITMPAGELATGLLYFETAYDGGAVGNTSTFYVDDVTITQAEELVVQELTPIKDTVDFPIGVAIDSRETGGAQAQLVNRHFEQVSSENFMKPEAFYTAEREFSPNAEGDLLMDFEAENDLRVWGHTLVWHAQTPAWFFQNAEGAPLTTSEADRQVLRDRMRQHIFDVAGYYAETHGLYGGGNPIVAFDVVNEVVGDGAQFDDGLRRSEWYRILGEEFIDLAFQYADEAFNGEFAAEGADRPVTLFINDYNTEQLGKQDRMRALLERLLDRGVPVDGLGHQFHVSLSFPVDALGTAIDRFADLPITQAVTELDVTTGTPESEALFVDQGYYYRDAFRDFRERAEELYSVTVWGLTDNRSWRAANGGPLLFDARLQAKPAYYGVIDGELPAPQRSANVFGATVTDVDDAQWQRMPDTRVDDEVAFQLRWAGDALTVLVEVADATPEAGDAVELELDGAVVSVPREDAQRDSADGWATVVALPLNGAGEGDAVGFDLRRFDGGELVSAWNAPGELGTLTLLEPLSFVEVVETAEAPVIDGAVDEAWAAANVVETGKQVEGTSGASATVRTLWRNDRLLVLMEVSDPVVDVSGSDPWIQDSVEIYVDAGNVKNGPYRYDDTQIRISAENVLSFGAGGDEGFQRARVESATALVDGGYVVEASISLLDSSGLGTVHGLDFQVNDASEGARTSIRNWADPSGAGYQSTARWGVGQLVAADAGEPGEPGVSIELGASSVRAGGTLPVSVSGLEPGTELELVLAEPSAADALRTASASLTLAAAAELPLVLGSFVADESGAVDAEVRIPAEVAAGDYELRVVVAGEALASADLQVTAAAGPGAGGPGAGAPGTGGLPVTGALGMLPLLALALLLLVGGAVLRHRRPAMR